MVGGCEEEDACLVFSAGGLAGLWGSVGLGLQALLRCHSLLLNLWQVLARSSSSPPVLHFLPHLPVTAHSQEGILLGCDRPPWGFGRQISVSALCCFSRTTGGGGRVLKLHCIPCRSKIQNMLEVWLYPVILVNTNMPPWLPTSSRRLLAILLWRFDVFLQICNGVPCGFVFLSGCHKWLGLLYSLH